VLPDVGERLLDDAVGGESDAVGHRRRRIREGHLDVVADDEPGQVREAGLRSELDAVVRAEQAERVAHLREGGAAGGGDRLEGRRGEVGVVRRRVARAVGLHHDRRQPVRDDVVHLAGDPRPLVRGRERDLLGRLAPDLLAALDQRVDVRPPDATEGAERPRGDHDRRDRDDVRGHAGSRELAVVPDDPSARGHERPAQPDAERDQAGNGRGVPGDRVDGDRERDLAPERRVDQQRLDGAEAGDDREDRHGVSTTPVERRQLSDGHDETGPAGIGERRREGRQQQRARERHVEPHLALRAEPPRLAVLGRGAHAATLVARGPGRVRPRVDAASSPSRVPSMTKWEYLTAPILTHAAKQILDNFGADGWELVQVAPGMNPENLVGYFKRPIEG
jgi:hypothetical protein